MLTDQRGAPLAVVVTGANCHDMKAATATLDSLPIRRPRPTPEHPEHLCLDKGYDYPEIEAAVRKRHYTPICAIVVSASRVVGATRRVAGSLSAPGPGITGSGNSLSVTKSTMRTTSGWCISHALSSSTDSRFWDRLYVHLDMSLVKIGVP